MLVKASNVAPEAFYNAYRDRTDLLPAADTVPAELDQQSRAVFGNGWYPANHLPPIARWMTARSWLSFKAERLSRISLQLTTHIPDLRTSPMELEFKLNGVSIGGLCLFEYDWLEVALDVPVSVAERTTQFKLEIISNRTWQPSVANPDSGDDRHLSIAVCNLRIS